MKRPRRSPFRVPLLLEDAAVAPFRESGGRNRDGISGHPWIARQRLTAPVPGRHSP